MVINVLNVKKNISYGKINLEKFNTPYMSIDDIINLLVEVRVDLTSLKKSVTSKDIKEQLKWAINGIDIVGCQLAQNIAKILKEK
jgi:predicted peroxiredoxin